MKKKASLIAAFGLSVTLSMAQIVVTSDTNAVQLVNNFILSGVTATNVLYTGADSTLGTFSGGNSVSLGIENGIVMTTGVLNAGSISSPSSEMATTSNGMAGDIDLDNLLQVATTYDASVLEFDLIPAGTVLEFQYVFASEEYPEFVGSSYNDVFGFFIDGQNPAGGYYIKENIAIVPGTTMPVAINNVNATTNAAYYIDNTDTIIPSVVFDGYTVTMLAQIDVIAGASYHLKMAIGDAGDGILDSGIFLKTQSMKSYNLTAVPETQKETFKVYLDKQANSIRICGLENTGTVSLHNTLGEQVLKQNISSNVVSINTESLTHGIYIVNVTQQGRVFAAKVAVN